MSACLLGRACRYDAQSKSTPAVERWVAARRSEGVQVIPVCPEELGGLGTPRPAAELRGGDGSAVLEGLASVRRCDDGTDVTAGFVQGARRAASLAEGAHEALLKARSPSCGCGASWIDGSVRPGDGVFAAILKRQGVFVRTEEELE